SQHGQGYELHRRLSYPHYLNQRTQGDHFGHRPHPCCSYKVGNPTHLPSVLRSGWPYLQVLPSDKPIYRVTFLSSTQCFILLEWLCTHKRSLVSSFSGSQTVQIPP